MLNPPRSPATPPVVLEWCCQESSSGLLAHRNQIVLFVDEHHLPPGATLEFDVELLGYDGEGAEGERKEELWVYSGVFALSIFAPKID